MRKTGPKRDLTGARYARWTVLGLSPDQVGRVYRWRCQCDCGNIGNVVGASLTNGSSRSCGCLQQDTVRKMKTKHGGKGTVEYRTWKKMRERCLNPNAKRYERYGGRGIKVCERWNDFANFLADMGPRPSDKHSIERRDVNGMYEPSNCCWATQDVQSANRGNTSFILYQGQKYKLIDVAKAWGVSLDTMHKRALRGSYGITYA